MLQVAAHPLAFQSPSLQQNALLQGLNHVQVRPECRIRTGGPEEKNGTNCVYWTKIATVPDHSSTVIVQCSSAPPPPPPPPSRVPFLNWAGI